ncbi:MAG: PBP1A family penicillin-binding protein [Gemmatimonadota bacterium]
MSRRGLVAVLVAVGLLGAGAAAVWTAHLQFTRLVDGLPRLPDHPADLGIRSGTEIFAASGERLYTFNQNRTWTRIDDLAPHTVQALLATEDAAFYHHRGVDLQAIGGAVWANLRHGLGTRGGSTLTQQLVKRLFFSPQKAIARKLSEMLLALQLEALYAGQYPGLVTTPWAPEHPAYKDRLLELYLNTVFFGANSYGIADAARTYFGLPPGKLTTPQAALLVGLPNAPSAYNPLQNPDRATRRYRRVLDRMRTCGYLTDEEWRTFSPLRAADLLAPSPATLNPTPYWVEAIREEVVQLWGPAVLRHGALRIHTTLDMGLQRAAERAVEWGTADLDERMGFRPYREARDGERPGYVQAALVCLDPHTGQVKAMVGGRDTGVSYYNRALAARRQPGSGFKPVAYLAALEAGAVTPVSLFVDEPRTYVDYGREWQPGNFEDRYLGLTTAAWALIHSANSTAVQVAERVGPAAVVAMARTMGFAGDMDPYLSIALGVNEVTVLEMASAFGALPASGLRVESTLVDRITDGDDRTLFTHRPAVHPVVDDRRAYQLLLLLQQVIDRGTGRRVRALGFDRPAAGKTGTTNDNTDAWFTGFTPDLVTSVWVGFDNRRQHRLVDRAGVQITGGSGAAPIWTRFMLDAVQGTPLTDFEVPPGLTLVEVDPRSGTLGEGLPDSLGQAVAPITVALMPGEAPNQPEEVARFEAGQEGPRPAPPGGPP